MQFEEFNKKIKEAAEQHHPDYDEKAWQRMEKLLRKNLPEEKEDKRRVLFFLLLFLLLGGGVFLVINQPWKATPTAGNETSIKVNESKPSPTKTELTPSTLENLPQKQKADVYAPNLEKLVKNDAGTVRRPAVISIEADKDIAKKQNEDTQIKDAVNNEINKEVSPQNNQDVNAFAKTDDVKEINPLENKGELQNSSEKINRKKESGKFLEGLSFNLSGGPDVSKAGNSRLGKTTFAFGAGISYNWRRFTLSTGVYSAIKIYTASEDDYKLGYALPANVKFEGADANCRVTEIPFDLAYNFSTKNKSNWFASAGLSSYLMKRESYTYWYSNSMGGGSYWSRNFEYKNKYKHYFSVVNLSAGYTRQLNNLISVTAEPYVKIPVHGIGSGKVWLNSGGVLFTIGVHPFDNKIKK